MKINIEVNLEDFLGPNDTEWITDEIKHHIKSEIQKAVKKDSRYKDYIKAQTDKILGNLE